MFAIIGYFVLINPYLWLLRASAIIPTKRMHHSDCYDIRDQINQLTSYAGGRKWKPIGRKLAIFRLSVRNLEKSVGAQNCKVRNFAPKYLEKLIRERSEVFGKLLRSDKLRLLLETDAVPTEIRESLCPLLDRIDRLWLVSEVQVA